MRIAISYDRSRPAAAGPIDTCAEDRSHCGATARRDGRERARGAAGLAAIAIAGLLTVAVSGATPVDAADVTKATFVSEKSRATPENPVDLNRADAAGLMSVPGIGPALADRIVAFREEHGPFRRVEDLLKVRGIGERSLEKLRPYLTVGGAKR